MDTIDEKDALALENAALKRELATAREALTWEQVRAKYQIADGDVINLATRQITRVGKVA